jgi:hypothetical protein
VEHEAMKIRKKIILFVLAVAAAGAADAKQVQLPMIYEPMAKLKLSKLLEKSLADNAACSFQVLPAQDIRPNKLSIGFNGANLDAQKVTDWLYTAMVALFDHTKRDQAKLQVTVEPKLTRLYTYHESMNILGVTSVILEFKVNGSLVETRQYRGFYAKTNWAAANGEYVTALNDAMNNMLPKIVNELTAVCQTIQKSVD